MGRWGAPLASVLNTVKPKKEDVENVLLIPLEPCRFKYIMPPASIFIPDTENMILVSPDVYRLSMRPLFTSSLMYCIASAGAVINYFAHSFFSSRFMYIDIYTMLVSAEIKKSYLL